MKIGLLASHRGQEKFEREHQALIAHLEKRGHEVVHSMNIKIEQLIPLSYVEREEMFMRHYQALEACDLVIAECTLQSTQVGFGLSYLRAKGKPTVILSQKGSAQELSPRGEVYSNVENLMVTEYTNLADLPSVLDDVLSYMEPHLDKRFTMIFPADLMAKLEELSIHKRLPKAVYIRQLIEKSLQEQDH